MTIENTIMENIPTMTKEKFLEFYNAISQEDIDKNYKGLDYISWANAYRMLIEADIDATYQVLENEKGFIFEQFGMLFVKTQVTAFGQTKMMWLPIMNNNHIAVKIEQMTGNQVNTSIMRCLTKNIAMFGIGLKLYVGEDIPKDDEVATKKPKEASATKPKQTKVKTLLDEVKDLCAKAIHEEKKDSLMAMLKTYHESGKLADIDASKLPEIAEKIKAL